MCRIYIFFALLTLLGVSSSLGQDPARKGIGSDIGGFHLATTTPPTELSASILRLNSVACVASGQPEEPNPAGPFFRQTSDDGPFNWLWSESSSTQSMHEFQAKKSRAKSGSSWLEIFPRKNARPKAPAVDLGQMSPFAKKKIEEPEASMWQSSKEKLGQWNERLKESTWRNWNALKDKWKQ